MGQWVYLSELPWIKGSTGWVAIANDDLPSLDQSFNGGKLAIGGETYAKGIGVYPLSEIEYSLDGRYALFESDLGLNDLPGGAVEDVPSRVVFSIFLDGSLAYDSGVISRRHLAVPVQLAVTGVHTLRLVVSASGPPSIHNYADWAGARLWRPEPVFGEPQAVMAAEAPGLPAARKGQRDEDRQALAILARTELFSMDASGLPTSSPPTRTSVILDPSRSAVLLSNGLLALTYGVGGAEHGMLTVLHVPTGRLLLYRANASVVAANNRLDLHFDTQPASSPGYRVEDVTDAVLGPGKRLVVDLAANTGALHFTTSFALFDRQPFFVSQITVEGAPIDSALRVNYFDSLGPSNLAIGDGLRYLTDITRLRTGSVEDDGIQRREAVDQGKPVYLSGDGVGLGLVLAALDESVGPVDLSLERDPGRVVGRLDLGTGPARASQRNGPKVAGPRLYVEAVTTAEPREAFRNFRDIMGHLYPPAPLPEWVRYQWLSWYTYYMDIDEQRIRRQIDYIAKNLADLGPWHIIVDAGWYVSEGRPDADWRKVDRGKFPTGLRALVDYAHEKNVKVVLYFSAPYLDSRAVPGDWLGLRGLIDRNPEWLIRLGEDVTRQSYVYDLDNPSLRSYLSDVMRDYFVTYDVDGIKIDGLGNGDGAAVSPGERDPFGLVGKVREPAMEIYRLVHDEATKWKPAAYMESGWLDPLFAAGLAHTFRYGDEAVAFSNRYPQPGLVEHIEYAIAQQSYWGQRANMGAVHGDPNEERLNEEWLAASLALGAQSSISFDLPEMTGDTLSRYRALLALYRPFEGQTFYTDTPAGPAFATIRDGQVFLGVLNRDGVEHQVELPFAALGLATGRQYLAYDVASSGFSLTENRIAVKLEPRSFRLFVLRDQPGLLWTNSSFSMEQGAGVLTLTVNGPADIAGFVDLLVPDLESVAMDGQPLAEGLDANPRGYSYDPRLGLLSVRYDHHTSHRLEITYGSHP